MKKSRFGMKKIFLFFFLLQLPFNFTFAKNKACSAVFKNDQNSIEKGLFEKLDSSESIYLPELTSEWRKVDGSEFAKYRSNSAYLWNEISQLQSLSEASQVKGLDLGDAHDLNFDFTLTRQNKAEITINDYDDVGESVSLLYGAAKRAAGNTLTAYNASHAELWEAYLTGLRGQIRQTPLLLQNFSKWTSAQFEKANADYLNKILSSDFKFTEKAKLILRNNKNEFDDKEIQSLFEKLNEEFTLAIQNNYGPLTQIADVGFRLKKNGGSQGLARFWYALKTPQGHEVIEFKFHNGSALKFANQAMDFKKSFAEVQTQLKTDNFIDEPLYIQTHLGAFWMRPRRPAYFELDRSEEIFSFKNNQIGSEEMKAVSLYLMNWYGLWQSKLPQRQQLINAIDKNPKAAFDDFQRIILGIQKAIKEHK